MKAAEECNKSATLQKNILLNIIFTHFQTSIFTGILVWYSKTHGWQGFFAFNCHYANQ